MCSNYEAITDSDLLVSHFGVAQDLRQSPLASTEVWPIGLAPFIRLAEDGSDNRVVEDGSFGLLPAFAKELAFGRKTYNARSETVHEKPSFRDAWRRGHRCIIPARLVYEQNHESGRAQRWAVLVDERVPMGIAGVYSKWKDNDGRVHSTFAMLTVNADGHPVYDRFAAPGKEKRMVLILEPKDYDRWLRCTPAEARSFFKQYAGPLHTYPAPKPGTPQRRKPV